jgi:predicted MFS family arabinose efflux permease
MNKLSKYLLLASFFGTCGETMITPLYGMFVNKIGGGFMEAGIGYAIFSIITGVIVIGSSKIKWFEYNLQLVVLIGFAIAAVGDFSYFFVQNAIGLFLVQITNGVSVGLLNPAWEALYTQNTEEGDEHRSWSLWGGGANISIGIGALLGAAVTTLFGFKVMFMSTAVMNAISIYYAAMIYRKSNSASIANTLGPSTNRRNT